MVNTVSSGSFLVHPPDISKISYQKNQILAICNEHFDNGHPVLRNFFLQNHLYPTQNTKKKNENKLISILKKKTIGHTSLIRPLLPVVSCFWDVFSKACKFTEILVRAFKVYKKTDYCRVAMMNYSIGAL